MAEYNREDIFSKSIRAGRRTYFFDVRSTRAGDYYLTITESKRDFNEDGTPFYKKHKIYLYKEDFANFKDGLVEVTDFIIKEKGEEVLLEIVSCEIAGQTACVMVRDGYLGMTFLDTLSFLKVDGQWKIYNKLYHVEKE